MEVDGVWKVFEVRASGIFIIKSLRKSLRQEIDQNGLDSVIQRLEQSTSSFLSTPGKHWRYS